MSLVNVRTSKLKVCEEVVSAANNRQDMKVAYYAKQLQIWMQVEIETDDKLQTMHAASRWRVG